MYVSLEHSPTNQSSMQNSRILPTRMSAKGATCFFHHRSACTSVWNTFRPISLQCRTHAYSPHICQSAGCCRTHGTPHKIATEESCPGQSIVSQVRQHSIRLRQQQGRLVKSARATGIPGAHPPIRSIEDATADVSSRPAECRSAENAQCFGSLEGVGTLSAMLGSVPGPCLTAVQPTCFGQPARAGISEQKAEDHVVMRLAPGSQQREFDAGRLYQSRRLARGAAIR